MKTILAEKPKEVRQIQCGIAFGMGFTYKLQQKWVIHWHDNEGNGGVEEEWRDVPVYKEVIKESNDEDRRGDNKSC